MLVTASSLFQYQVMVVAVASAAQLRPGQRAPPGAAGAGGGQFLATPNGGPYQGARSVPGPFAPAVGILSYSNQPPVGDGSYSFRFEGENGIQAQESGAVGGGEGGSSAQGVYSYISPEGATISLSYVAGEEGFLPQGAHLPTAPPVPELILEALQKNAADEAAGIFDDGSYKP